MTGEAKVNPLQNKTKAPNREEEQRRQLLMIVLRLEYISDGDEAGYLWPH